MSARAAGFTLIEVLVALVIVAVGMGAVLSALSSSANTLSFLRDETFAQYVALNQIATLRLAGQQPPTGNSDGDLDYAGRSWHWRQEVVTTDVPGILRIDVKVRPKEVKGGDDDSWTTTVSGLYGAAIGRADGYNPSWGAQMPTYAPNANGQGQTIGANGVIGSQPGGATLGGTTTLDGSSSGFGSPGDSSGLSSTDNGLGSSGNTQPAPGPQSQP